MKTMRRFIIILMVMMGMITTSCKTESGTMYLEPIDIGYQIALEAHKVMCQTNEIITLALLADAYFSTEDIDTRTSIANYLNDRLCWQIESNNDGTSIMVFDVNHGRLSYCFTLQGGLLSEGGTWHLGESFNATYIPTAEGIEVSIIIPDANFSSEANFVIGDTTYSMEDQLSYTMNGTMTLQYNAIGTHLTMNITEPLCFSTATNHKANNYYNKIVGFYGGTMEATYFDAETGITDKVDLEHLNSDYAVVSYLGEVCRMTK